MKSPLLPLLQKYPPEIKYFKQTIEGPVESNNYSDTASDQGTWDYNYKDKNK